MDNGPISFSVEGDQATLIVQTLVWLVAAVACAVAVRRPWAWFGLPGAVLGTAVAAIYLADDIKVRADIGEPSAQVFDSGYDYPGFLLDHDLDGLLDAAQTCALALVAAAFVAGAVLSRRRDRAAAE